MNTERSDKGDYPPNTTKILAIVGVCLGVGLLIFGTPAGLPALAGPALVGFWPLVAIVCLVLGLIGLKRGTDIHVRRDGESSVSNLETRTDRSACEGLETKLRQLLRLKEQNLITEEEYNHKRAQILEKW
jgi:hypothetical protein